MKINELIMTMENIAAAQRMEGNVITANDCHLAAETIRLLWEVAKDTTNAQYKRQIDEMRGEDGNAT